MVPLLEAAVQQQETTNEEQSRDTAVASSHLRQIPRFVSFSPLWTRVPGAFQRIADQNDECGRKLWFPCLKPVFNNKRQPMRSSNATLYVASTHFRQIPRFVSFLARCHDKNSESVLKNRGHTLQNLSYIVFFIDYLDDYPLLEKLSDRAPKTKVHLSLSFVFFSRGHSYARAYISTWR